jgi:hypothetical protein
MPSLRTGLNTGTGLNAGSGRYWRKGSLPHVKCRSTTVLRLFVLYFFFDFLWLFFSTFAVIFLTVFLDFFHVPEKVEISNRIRYRDTNDGFLGSLLYWKSNKSCSNWAPKKPTNEQRSQDHKPWRIAIRAIRDTHPKWSCTNTQSCVSLRILKPCLARLCFFIMICLLYMSGPLSLTQTILPTAAARLIATYRCWSGDAGAGRGEWE